MTKEQAIERLKRIDVKFFISGMNEASNYIIDEADKVNNAIETVLSILKEKDRKIERLEKVLDEKYIFVQGARTVYARLMSLDKEDIVKDDLALRNEIYQHIKDNEKKDKMIDLMVEEINETDRGYTDYCEMKIECDRNCKDCIKRYFERKSEE